MQACMVCMYVCFHIGVHCWQNGVSLRVRNTDGNPTWVCRIEAPRKRFVTCYIASQLRTGRPLEQVSHLSGCTRVCIAHVHTWVHWMHVYGYGLSEDKWLSRVSRVEERSKDRYSEMDVCT